MRYREFKLMEFDPTPPEQSVQQVAADDRPDVQPVQPQTDPIVLRFIQSCLPPELEPRERAQALQWLQQRITHPNQLNNLDSDDIKLALRQHYAEGVNYLGGDLHHIVQRADIGDRSGIDDGTALAQLIAASTRLTNEVVMTVVSDTADGAMNLKQMPFDLLKNIGGKVTDAHRVESFINAKYNVKHGIYLHFRELKDPIDAAYAVLIDTDRHLIRVGRKYKNMRLITDRNYNINTEALRRVILAGSIDRERQIMYDVMIRKLAEFQALMNDDQVLELYNQLEIDYEDTAGDQIDQGDDDYRANRKNI
jgi:hypothetical protein